MNSLQIGPGNGIWTSLRDGLRTGSSFLDASKKFFDPSPKLTFSIVPRIREVPPSLFTQLKYMQHLDLSNNLIGMYFLLTIVNFIS